MKLRRVHTRARFCNRRPLLGAALLVALAAPGCDDDGSKSHHEATVDAGADAEPRVDLAVVDAVPPDGDLEDAGDLPDAGPVDCVAVEGTLGPAGGTLTVVDGPTSGSSITLPPGALAAETRIRIECADGVVDAAHLALGRTVRIRAEVPTPLLRAARITVTFDPARTPEGLRPNHLRLFWQSDRHGYVSAPPMLNPEFAQLAQGQVQFNSPGLGDFGLGHRPEVGTLVPRRFTYKAITGVSMGAGAAALLGLRNPDRFDVIAPLGGAVDWPYLLGYISGRLMGGFCTVDDPAGVGSLCALPPPTDPLEHPGDYNAWYFADNGGAFDRDEYVKIFQDLSYAYGNPLIYNPASPFLPPGVPSAQLRLPENQRCLAECLGDGRVEVCRQAREAGQPCFCDEVCPDGACEPETLGVAQGFFDDEYNPDGLLAVIPYCEGETGPTPGVYNPEVPHRKPVEVLLAVDFNGNGRRDPGEPPIRNTSEPYADVGCDGVPSVLEPGYDPITNPDPAGDDYDWYRNGTGTEANGLYDGGTTCGDAGEPYDDFGLDGVPGSPQYEDGGYDYGEGNGQFDDNPNYARFLARSPGALFAALSPEDRARVGLWIDGGVRDIFNFGVAGQHLTGRLQAQGENIRIYDDFPYLLRGLPEAYLPQPAVPDPFGEYGDSVFLRYGKPDATPQEIVAGDGAHVGSALQILNRFLTMFDWVLHRWPEGDKTLAAPADRPLSFEVDIASPRTGRRIQYFVDLPPGYANPANAEQRYPVVLLLHGYGQSPDDLPVAGSLLAGAMGRGAWPKAIIVYPDGTCGQTQVRACGDGVDNDGDGLLDAPNANRRACEPAGEACAVGYTCRPTAGDSHWCCPEGWNTCGAPDAQCIRPDGRTEAEGPAPRLCADGVDNDRDGRADLEDEGCMDDPEHDEESECKRGSFYTPHVARRDGRPGGPDWEAMLLDLLDDVDVRFRTKAPAVVDVPY